MKKETLADFGKNGSDALGQESASQGILLTSGVG
jgi:hypothetical protein